MDDAVVKPPERPSAGRRVELDRVSLRRGRETLLTDFSWSHEQGTVAWLVGENGAGKSSLLRVLAGRLRPTTGQVRLLPLGNERPRTVYYHPGMRLPPDATVADWQRLVAGLLGTERGDDGGPLMPPWASGDKRLPKLSTGEAKRLLLDALLRQHAGFIFLDEPYEHLSEPARQTLTDLLLKRARDSVVIVATNQALPREASGHPVVVLDGDRAILGDRREVTP
jgi:ABC-type multidrug transport system ATPase subunit